MIFHFSVSIKKVKFISTFIVAICIIALLLFSSCYASMHFCCKCKVNDCPVCLHIDRYNSTNNDVSLIDAPVTAFFVPSYMCYQDNTFHQLNTLLDLMIRLNN